MEVFDAKLEKLQKLLTMMDDSLTREEFVQALESVVNQILKFEAELTDRDNKHLMEFKAMCEASLRDIKNRNSNDLSSVKLQAEAITEELTSFIQEKRKEIEDKLSEIVDGKDGVDGIDGAPGKDGSPDSPIEVRDKLESLKDGEKLSIQAIQDLAEKLEELGKKMIGGVKGQKYGSIRTRYMADITPTGTIDGANKVFTLSKTPETGSLKVYRGGARQRVTEDYTFSGKTITFTLAPQVGEVILVDFRY